MALRESPRTTPRRAKRRTGEKRSRLGWFTALALLVLVGAYLGVLEISRPHVSGDRLRLDTFVDLAERGRLRDAKVLNVDSYLVGTYLREDESVAEYNAPYLKESQERLVDILLENRVPTTVDQQTLKRLAQLAGLMLPGFILIVLFVYLILSSRRGTGLFKVRSGARRVRPEPGGVTFADVAGQDEAVAELREVQGFLSDPERFALLGAEVPKGVLLYGPPGCGKTLLARALAGEAGANFYSISGSDFVELYVGVGAARVRDLFKEARENAPAVIFIDELDSIGRARSTGAALLHHSEQEQALNQILAEMDGFSNSDGVIVLAATNRPDILDPALLRPGRFDRTVGLERPDEDARLAILKVHAQGKRLGPDVDLAHVARKAVGLTGADLAGVVNEGAMLAARAGLEHIGHKQLEDALRWVLAAPERQRRLSMRERSAARRFATDQEKVTFADVAGQEVALEELREIRGYLAEPEKYAGLGAQIPRGVLLYGPPGCGKTLMARALAGEVNAAFFSISGPELLERYVGVGASRIRDLFAEARQMAPAIIFIDEIDTLGRSRVPSTPDELSGSSGQDEALNQILAEMDGFSPNQGVIVLAATNRADVLDPALLRPGRFDRSIGLEFPTEEGRLAILTLHAKGKVLAPDADLTAIASRAHGLTGADLANVMNEAALLAARRDRDAVAQGDLQESLQRVLRAPDRQRRLSSRARSVGRRFSADERVTFADVAGVDDAIEELRDVKDYLAAPERFAEIGAIPPRGILLSGAPGCGKTLLARAVAGEANAAFISAAASEFVQFWVGQGASRVRDLFAEARSMAPAIVFIDEFDAIGGHRTTATSGGSREYDQTLNQLLTELDGFEPRTAVVVMAATNRPDILDSALVRPGRFDRKVEISTPDRAGRRAILAVHARGKPLGPDVDLDALAGLSRGFSGADLAAILNEAALLALRRGSAEITMALVHEAIDRAYLGITSRTRLMTDEERRVVAYHEAGHALVARGVEGAAPPYKLTIAPRGRTLGHCVSVEAFDRVVYTRSHLMGRMATALGGWAAEKLVFGETGAGASSDIENARDLARRMVVEYGMSDQLGPLGAIEVATASNGHPAPPSEATVAAIRQLADQAFEKANAVLVANRVLLDRVAEALLERESLTALELEDVASAAGQPAPSNGAGNGANAGRGGSQGRRARVRDAPRPRSS